MSDPLLAKILSAVNAVRKDLQDHMRDEETELLEIRENAQRNREESERRHNALIQSITSYMEKQIHLEQAFIADQHGQPDIAGHRDDHLTRKEFAKWAAEVRADVTKGVLKAGFIGLLAWVGYALWSAFLQGPRT